MGYHRAGFCAHLSEMQVSVLGQADTQAKSMTFIWIRSEELHEYEEQGWTLVSIRMSLGSYMSYLMRRDAQDADIRAIPAGEGSTRNA